MPFLMICGRPCSGKTTVAKQVAEYLRGKGETVEIVNEEALSITRKVGLADFTAEKRTRISLMSSVERSLRPGVTVICDSLNYIKGYRYQLHCVSKENRTTAAIVFVDTSRAICEARNRGRGEADQLSPETFDSFWNRFETPDERNRWESPLLVLRDGVFETAGSEEVGGVMRGSGGRDIVWEGPEELRKGRVAVDDSVFVHINRSLGNLSSAGTEVDLREESKAIKQRQTQLREERERNADGEKVEKDELPKHEDIEIPEHVSDEFLAAIDTLLLQSKGQRPNKSTLVSKGADATFLHEIERLTADVLMEVQRAAEEFSETRTLKMPHTDTELVLRRKMTVDELRSAHVQFQRMVALHPPDTPAEAASLFVAQLNAMLEN